MNLYRADSHGSATLGTCFGIKKWDNFKNFDSLGFASSISTTCQAGFLINAL